MDLAVVGVHLAADHHGVERPLAGLSNIPATTVVPRSAATRATSVTKGPSSGSACAREVGAGVAEVAGEGLGQHDQVGAVGHRLTQPPTVGLGVQRRRLLHQHDLHGASLPPRRRRRGGRATGRAEWAAVVLTGGTASRMGGADKAALARGGRRLLDLALEAVAGADEVVVVGPAVPTRGRSPSPARSRPGGGPLAGLAAGVAALTGDAARSWCWPSTCPTSPPRR